MSSHHAVEKLRRLAASYPEMYTASALHGCLVATGLTSDDFDAVPPALCAGLGLAGGEAPTMAMRQTVRAGLEALDDEFADDGVKPLLRGEDHDEPLAAWCRGFLAVVDAEPEVWTPWAEESGFLHSALETLRAIATGVRFDVRDSVGPGKQAGFELMLDELAQEVFDLKIMATTGAPPLPEYLPADVATWDVEDVIAKLSADGELAPRLLVEELARRGAAALPLIGAVLMADAPWEDDDILPLHFVFALGAMRTPEADALLLVALEAIEAFPDWPWWDGLNGMWPRAWPAPGEDALGACAEIVADSGRDWLMRTQALGLVAAAEQRAGAARLEAWIDAAAARFEITDEDEAFLVSCLHFLLDFPRERHRALLEIELVEEPDPEVANEISPADLEHAFARGDAPEWESLGDPWTFYDADALRQRRREIVLEALEAETASQEPVVREGAKVGRNDPCPCGSGLKYKKCCLH
jgi:uncharacterized protein YecA (UPF0149 family)